MGRRNGGRSLQETLRRRLESCKSRFSTADELATHLRSTYPDYHRTKHQTLIRFVQEALHSTPKPTPKHCHDDDDDDIVDEGESQSASRKRRKKIDQTEERLQRIEALHMRRRVHVQSDASSSSASESDNGEGEETVSTSEDAIYEEKVEPEFDLMKAMLRKSYTPTKKAAAEEKNIELEVGNSSKVATLVNEERKQSKGSVSSGVVNEERKQSKGSVSSSEVKGKNGPMFKDLGGMKEVLELLEMEVFVPLLHPHVPRELGLKPVAGILLHGPPGCGKTKLAHAIANETGVPFYHISAPEVVSGVSGASEENIRELFSKAYRTAPSIVFIDEIDAIASKRDNLQREMEKRIVTQLMTCMDPSDNSESSDDRHPGFVLVIGATNRPDAIDSALRRPGRFDLEIIIGTPDESAREEILSVLTRNLKLEGLFDLGKIARATSGYVGADLAALVYKAGNLAMKRIIDERKHDLSQDRSQDWWKEPWSPEEITNLAIKMSDFEKAVEKVQPSSRREGFSSIPNVKWEDVGGLDLLRKEFERCIIRRIKYPKDYEGFGVDLETGFLLYGPPGCGKTLIAKAVASEAGASFIHIKGPELLNKYVGESELAVRTLFSRARTSAPCIIFFDEVDALTTQRGKEGGWVIERLLNQLLIELDGAEQRRGVFVIGATNRPEVMDRALLRPGRFGKLLYVPLPSPDERVLILKALARKKSVDASVDLSAIAKAEACENLSGADLAALMNEAAMAALEEKLDSTEPKTCGTWTIKRNHFDVALSKVSPSVSDRQMQYYQHLSKSFKSA